MTAIVAIEHGAGVLVACDSFLGNGAEADRIAEPKWWRASGILVAYAGDIKVPQLAAAAPKRLRHRAGEADAAFVQRYAEALRAIHRERHIALGHTDYLLAYRGRAYVAQGDASLVRSAFGYAAIGAGYRRALTALALSCAREPALAPQERALAVLAAVAQHCPTVAPPWRWVDLPYLQPAPEAAPEDPARGHGLPAPGVAAPGPQAVAA